MGFSPNNPQNDDGTRIERSKVRVRRLGYFEEGSVTLDGYVQWASFTVASDPGKDLALIAALVAITGLALSLLVRRRRVWVRVSSGAEGVTLVEVAGLTRSEHASVADEVDALAATLGTATTTRTTAPQGPEENR